MKVHIRCQVFAPAHTAAFFIAMRSSIGEPYAYLRRTLLGPSCSSISSAPSDRNVVVMPLTILALRPPSGSYS